MDEANIRYVYRPAPCPAYDVEGTESWLTDLAAEGFVLTSDGFLGGIGIFARTEPRRIKYRLEAAERGSGLLGDGDAPDGEAVALGESMGWQYVARRGEFYVYASTEPGARELNTDPAVQALALGQVVRRMRGSVVNLIAAILVWCVLLPILRGHGQILISAVNIGTWFWLWGNLLFLWFIADSFRCALHLGRLHRRLVRDGRIDHEKNWRRSAARHYLVRCAKLVLIVSWIIVLLLLLRGAVLGEHEVAIADYTGDPPFPTLVDFAPADDYTYEPSAMNIANTVREWSDWLSPVNFRWEEIAAVICTDGTAIEGGFYVDYHEMRTEWLAAVIAREYHRVERFDLNGDYAPIEIALPEVDYAVAFYDSVRMPTVVMQNGKKVICVTFHQYSRSNVPMEAWAARMAECLR